MSQAVDFTPLAQIRASAWTEHAGEPFRPPFVLLSHRGPRAEFLEPSVARYLATQLMCAADEVEQSECSASGIDIKAR